MRSFKDFVGDSEDSPVVDEREELEINMACFTCGSQEVKVYLISGNMVGVCPQDHESVLPWNFNV